LQRDFETGGKEKQVIYFTFYLPNENL